MATLDQIMRASYPQIPPVQYTDEEIRLRTELAQLNHQRAKIKKQLDALLPEHELRKSDVSWAKDVYVAGQHLGSVVLWTDGSYQARPVIDNTERIYDGFRSKKAAAYAVVREARAAGVLNAQ